MDGWIEWMSRFASSSSSKYKHSHVPKTLSHLWNQLTVGSSIVAVLYHFAPLQCYKYCIMRSCRMLAWWEPKIWVEKLVERAAYGGFSKRLSSTNDVSGPDVQKDSIFRQASGKMLTVSRHFSMKAEVIHQLNPAFFISFWTEERDKSTLNIHLIRFLIFLFVVLRPCKLFSSTSLTMSNTCCSCSIFLFERSNPKRCATRHLTSPTRTS